MADDDLLSRKAAAAYLRKLGIELSPGTLANMAAHNNARKGPPFIQFRWRTVRYRRGDLDEWIKRESRRVE